MGQDNRRQINFDDDLDDEITGDEIKRIFKNHPHDYIAKLEEIGFIYHDDDIDEEELEEAKARPLNTNQEYLVSFFNGDIALSEKTVVIFYGGPHCQDKVKAKLSNKLPVELWSSCCLFPESFFCKCTRF